MPFVIETMGRIDPKLPQYFPLEELVKYHMYVGETIERDVRSVCKGKDFYCPVFFLEDLEGVSMSHMSSSIMNMVKQTAKMDSDNYPESIRKVIIMNCPKVFSVLWGVAQYFFDENQKSKFEFYGYSEDYQTSLLKIVSPENLPKRYGGDLDWDLPPGGDVKKLSLPKTEKKRWIKTHIPRGGNYEKALRVEKGHTISWEFKTERYDIGFAVFFRESPDSTREVAVEYSRIESDLSEVYGAHVVDKPAEFILFWDNSYSWVNGKDLKYILYVEDLEGEITQISDKGITTKGQKEKK
eukprot:TRINITY_DN464_c0_g1_i22.p1 TRINITY_DN464_c0_g1~~TRINITY_DN464_c0_g1_i22.p1  ORF type:complete len:296 (+),score=65.81 TRINITY_DN464_c0_g1_i22:873-1760(+)